MVVLLVAIGGTFGVMVMLHLPDIREMEVLRAELDAAREQAEQAMEAERVARHEAKRALHAEEAARQPQQGRLDAR